MIKYSLRFGIFVHTDGLYVRMTTQIFKFKDVNKTTVNKIIRKMNRFLDEKVSDITIRSLCETEFSLCKKPNTEDVYNLSFLQADGDEIVEYEIYYEEIRDFIDTLDFITQLSLDE